MAVLPLVIAPDPRLNLPSQPVKAVTAQVRQLAEDMLETMYANNGIGLAAVQVGVHQKIIVVDVEWPSPRYEDDPEGARAKRNPLVLINAEIAEESDEINRYNEGCLSFPDQYSEVERPADVTIRYMDLDGHAQRIKARGLLATCIQHEIDHTNGVVFVDHISKLKRDMIHKKLIKQKKLGAIPNIEHKDEAPL